jgi:hypothetical protein
VPGAGNFVAEQPPFDQRPGSVQADIIEGVKCTAHVGDSDLMPAYFVHLHLANRHILHRPYRDILDNFLGYLAFRHLYLALSVMSDE